MKQPNTDDTRCYFFLVTEKYALGTPAAIAASDRTRDIPFHALANNPDLQARLNLESAKFISRGDSLIKPFAGYLSAFCNDPQERSLQQDYLINNGLVRLLVNDPELERELDELQVKQETKAIQNALETYERRHGRVDSDEMDVVGTDFMTNQPIFRCRE